MSKHGRLNIAMRVAKNILGQYVVEDEPVRLDGKAAKAFLATMSEGPVQSDERARFLAECDAVYTKAKKRWPKESSDSRDVLGTPRGCGVPCEP